MVRIQTLYAVYFFNSRHVLEKGKQKVREDSDNISEFSSMLQQSYSDERYPKHTDLAIWVAYNVFYEPGERRSFI